MARGLQLGLKLFQTLIYILAFCSATVIFGLYVYFVALENHHDDPVRSKHKAIVGISGAAMLYSLCGVLFTCCLGGMSFFAFLAVLLDLAFVGGFIANLVMTSLHLTIDSCNADQLRTPLGDGARLDQQMGTSHGAYAPTFSRACKLNKASFAVSIIGAGLFFVAALVQLALMRRHKHEKRMGPTVDNHYTSGYGTRPSRFGNLWPRRNRARVVPTTTTVPTAQHSVYGTAV